MPIPATAILFHPDAIESEGASLVGRRSSGQSFLRGYLDHGCGDTINAVVRERKHGAAFRKVLEGLKETRPSTVLPLHADAGFDAFGTLFFPGPGMMSAPWVRQHRGEASCSLVGITHTVSTRRVMEGLHTLLSEPVHPWDAVICTSRAVHSVVATQWEQEAAFLKDRFGAARMPMPQLPIIPLGIHTQDFAPSGVERKRLRDRMGVTDDSIVVMTMGRLTSVEKANMLPLWLALEAVAQSSGRDVHLWQVGWAGRAPEHDLHVEGPKTYCPSVTTQTLDGREPDLRRGVWSAADIFTLPVDNIQETFGLVPVEAMAAGLPVVMPDWNGFRDTVVDGKTGFLIPTTMAPPDRRMGRIDAIRAKAQPSAPLRPLCIDPFSLYQGYPSRALAQSDRIASLRPLDAASLSDLDRLSGRALYKRRVLPDPQTLALARQIAETGETTVGAVMVASPLKEDQVIAGLLFLAKFGFVTITPQQSK
ncbi:MAG: glycosyltransferase family 4 protein [Loktanella sp.]|nr:glycosyltransferase family 4 protein [Loktanella sp.]